MDSLSLPQPRTLLPSLPLSTIPSQLSTPTATTTTTTITTRQLNSSTMMSSTRSRSRSSNIEGKVEEKREAFTSRLLHLAQQREAQQNSLLLQSQLQRRIYEVKSKERGKEVEKVMNDLLLLTFLEAGQTLMVMPSLDGEAMLRPERHKKLKAVLMRYCLASCSEEEVDAIAEHHLNRAIGAQGRVEVGAAMDMKMNMKMKINGNYLRVQKLRVGRVYAASMMYGYFLNRVSHRYALQRNFSISLQEKEKEKEEGFGLRLYIDGIDPRTLRTLGMMRSNEAIGVIESRSQSLFGKQPGEGMLIISHLDLERMLLEALLLGAFLFQVETYIDCYYTIM